MGGLFIIVYCLIHITSNVQPGFPVFVSPAQRADLAEMCGNRIEKAFSTLNYDAFILLSPSELQRHVFHQMVMERSVSGSLQTSILQVSMMARKFLQV